MSTFAYLVYAAIRDHVANDNEVVELASSLLIRSFDARYLAELDPSTVGLTVKVYDRESASGPSLITTFPLEKLLERVHDFVARDPRTHDRFDWAESTRGEVIDLSAKLTYLSERL